ncbi:MAG: AAA family ATPase, partial [Caldisericaceae bacterium]
GRAIYGTIDSIRDIIEGEKSILLLGKPGVGKTTLLREAARVLSDEMGKRVIVVDTSNEIGGDGDIPHPGIGSSRRMQVPFGRAQEDVMIEAVENHFPEVIIIDEIGRTEEAKACRTIAERGVRLIATAHGISIENLMVNPTLQDLIGGIAPVTLSDEEAIRRGTQKTILERESPPTFDVLIEIRERGVYAIYNDVSETIDSLLRGFPVNAEVRTSGKEATYQRETVTETEEIIGKTKIFPIGINSSYLERAINSTRAQVEVVKDLGNADLILADKRVLRKKEELLDFANRMAIKVEILDKPSLNDLKNYVKRIRNKHFVRVNIDFEKLEEIIREVIQTGTSKELPPDEDAVLEEERNIVAKFGLSSETIGINPNRRLVIHPRKPK